LSHTQIANDLPFHVGLQHLANRNGTPVAVVIVKATFDLARDGLRLAEQQLPTFPAGQAYGAPGESSYRYEPEAAYFKPATDVVLIGAAVPPAGADTQVNVSFSVGRLGKRAVAFGDRSWVRGFAGTYLSDPQPFESMPLVYERAFGGWDRSDPDPDRHTFEVRNPVGTGFSRKFPSGQDRIALPNIEDPTNLIISMDSRPKPVGFGFTSPDWKPRASLAGTYDSSWAQTRMPLLPEDFDPRFFNGASEGLISDRYMVGNEQVTLENCSSEPSLGFCLPGIPPPCCRFRITGQTDYILNTNLDTVVINTLDNIVVLTWRCHVPLPRGPEFLLELNLSRGE
jgi:hypothetical protein